MGGEPEEATTSAVDTTSTSRSCPPSPERVRPPLSTAQSWSADARCTGHTEAMFDHARRGQARALCAVCPVVDVCLWTTMAAEAADPYPYRYGTAGGLGPLQRQRLANRLDPGDINARLWAALARWGAGETSAPPTPWRPPAPAYRPRRTCRGCATIIRQPRAGRPQLWCSPRCYQRGTVDRGLDAARNRGRWAELPEAAKARRRQAMRARWAALSDDQRAELASRRRQRRQTARMAS